MDIWILYSKIPPKKQHLTFGSIKYPPSVFRLVDLCTCLARYAQDKASLEIKTYFCCFLKWWTFGFAVKDLPVHTLGIQSLFENGSMEPKYCAFRRWLDTPIADNDWMPRDIEDVNICDFLFFFLRWQVFWVEGPFCHLLMMRNFHGWKRTDKKSRILISSGRFQEPAGFKASGNYEPTGDFLPNRDAWWR